MEPVTEFEPPAVHHTGRPNNVSYARQELEHLTTYCISSQLPFLQVDKDLQASSVVDTAVSNEKLVKRIIVIACSEKKIRAPITISSNNYGNSLNFEARQSPFSPFVKSCTMDPFTDTVGQPCETRLVYFDASSTDLRPQYTSSSMPSTRATIGLAFWRLESIRSWNQEPLHLVPSASKSIS